MQKFDKGAAWDDVKRLLASHRPLILAVAGAFVFLPQLIFDLVAGPAPTSTGGVSPEAEAALLTSWFSNHWWLLLIMGLAVLVGTTAIMRLWLARTSTSVSEALVGAAVLVPAIFVAQIVSSVAVAFGILLLIIPGLYLYARLCAVGPLAADLNIRNPAKLIAGSWNLTKGNGFSILLFLALVIVAAAIVYVLLASIAAVILGIIPSVGPILVKIASAALSTVFNVLIVALVVSVYRQLVAINGEALQTV